MNIIKNKIINYLNKKDLSCYKLSKILNYHEGALNAMINGKKAFPEYLAEKLLLIINVSHAEFTSWIVADKYSKEVLLIAIEELKNKFDDSETILKKNIDNFCIKNNLSRTSLSKLIKYDQGAFNKMVSGKIPMSKTVILKLTPVLGVSENIIQAWILADKYSLEILEMAISCQS